VEINGKEIGQGSVKKRKGEREGWCNVREKREITVEGRGNMQQ